MSLPLKEYNLQEVHILRKLDEKVTMSNPCFIESNAGDIVVSQAGVGIFEASCGIHTEVRATASTATMALINTLRNQMSIDRENY